MKIKKTMILSVVLMVGVLFMLGACTSQKTADMPPGEVQKTNAEKEKMLDTTQPVAETGNTGSSTALTALMTKSASLKYKVTYNVKSTVQAKTVEVEMTQYMDLPARMRFDTQMQGVESRSYLNNDKYTVCSKMGSDWNCFEQAYVKPESETAKDEIVKDPAKYTITELPSRTIAGATAKCFQTVQTNSTVEYCYSSEGVPLYVKSSVNGAVVSEMTATTYSLSVADADFEIPAGASTQNLNDLMKNVPTDGSMR